jgi:cytochrome c
MRLIPALYLALAVLPHLSAAPLRIDTIAENFHDPMELAVAPDGSIYVIEREGRVLRVNPATGGTFVIGTVEVTALRESDPKSGWAREDGLLGMALAPDFATSQQLYLYYSHPEELLNRLSRFTLKSGLLDLSSEQALLDVKTDRRDAVCHQGGSLQFGPDGLLHLSTGDNTNPFQSAGKAPIDDREGRDHTDAMRSAGNTNDLRGKILRIRPTAKGYEIPAGNLFKPGTAKTRPEIYAMGCRNPFRLSIDPKTRYVYWGEVGPDSRKADDKGPMGFDEINQARAAGNFGWPFVIADNKPYPIVDFDKGEPGALTDPAAPRNPGTRNTGLDILPPAQQAFIWYPYVDSEEFPAMKSGGRNAMAGPAFYYDSDRKHNILPREDDHSLLTYDWMRGRIWKARLDKNDNQTSLEEITAGLRPPMDLEMAGDGSLWLLEYGSGWYFNKDGRVRQILPASDNQPPSIEIEASPGEPKSWQVKSIKDPENDKVTIEWWLTVGTGETKLGSGSKITVPAANGSELRAVAIDAKGNRSFARISLQDANSAKALELELAADHLAPGGSLGFKIKGLADPAQALVRLRYIPPTGHDAGTVTLPAAIEQNLTDRLCFACHQTDAKSIGPRYTDVALRYKGQDGALETLKQKLKTGGVGNWGEIPMPPQLALTAPEADQALHAILELGKLLTEHKGAAEGTLQAPANIPDHEPGGSWEITAESPGHQATRLRIADR